MVTVCGIHAGSSWHKCRQFVAYYPTVRSLQPDSSWHTCQQFVTYLVWQDAPHTITTHTKDTTHSPNYLVLKMSVRMYVSVCVCVGVWARACAREGTSVCVRMLHTWKFVTSRNAISATSTYSASDTFPTNRKTDCNEWSRYASRAFSSGNTSPLIADTSTRHYLFFWIFLLIYGFFY